MKVKLPAIKSHEQKGLKWQSFITLRHLLHDKHKMDVMSNKITKTTISGISINIQKFEIYKCPIVTLDLI